MTNYLEADRKLRRAREALAVRTTVNADQAESISTYEHTPKFYHATRLFGVIVDYGWCQRTICSNCYENDAIGIAHALAAVYDCEVK
jgi:hypothetical protein